MDRYETVGSARRAPGDIILVLRPGRRTESEVFVVESVEPYEDSGLWRTVSRRATPGEEAAWEVLRS